MERTINSAFDTMQSNIELPSGYTERISSRYSAIKDHLLSVFSSGTRIRQIGSFQRNTKVRPSRDGLCIDLDVAVVLGDVSESEVTRIKPVNIFAKLLVALQKNKNYKSMKPKPDAPTIQLVYADGFSVEMVPCFRIIPQQIELTDRYYISIDRTNWIVSDYDGDAKAITHINQELCNGTLVPFIKQMKYLLRRFKQFDNMSSIHIEALCAKIYPDIMRDFGSSWIPLTKADYLARFLTIAPRYIAMSIPLPGSRSSAFGSELHYQNLQSMGQVMMHIGTCAHSISNQPLQQQLKYWQSLYGSVFPVA